MQFAVTSDAHRAGHFEGIAPLVKATLEQQEDVLIHCKVGRHRGAIAAAKIMHYLSPGKPMLECIRVLEQCRYVEISKVLQEVVQRRRGRQGSRALQEWLYDARARQVTIKQQGKIVGFRSSTHSNALLHVIVELERTSVSSVTAPACRHQRQLEASLHKDRLETADILEALAWGKSWCKYCYAILPGSLLAVVH